jgi:hypothetical protein
MDHTEESGEGERTRDPRERDELERVTGDRYAETPAAGGDEAASDDVPLTDTPRQA